jgi:hypothetical protein
MATLNFDATTVTPMSNFDALPAGKYKVVISNSEVKENRSGTGSYLQLEFDVIEGEYANRKLWTRLNLWHSNSEAARIAASELSAICRAVNLLQVNDSSQLHNLPMIITVKCRKTPNDEIVNDIKSYEMASASGGAVPTLAPVAPQTALPQQGVPSNPWGNRNV